MATRLALSYSQTALFVKNVDRLSVWYAERGSSRQAAVAFTRVGEGRLGYFGDVNGEEMSTAVVMAMCRLLGCANEDCREGYDIAVRSESQTARWKRRNSGPTEYMTWITCGLS